MPDGLDERLTELLGGIRVLPRRLLLRTDADQDALQVPTLRGVWGRALHGLDTEAYESVFHPQGHGRRPAYVLRPAPPDPTFAPAIEWISIGRAIDFDEILLRAWDVAGGMGLGKQREPFFVAQQVTLGPDFRPANHPSPWPLAEAAAPLGSDAPAASCRLEFVTPLSLLRDHELIREPTLLDIIVRACRRIADFLPASRDQWEEVSSRAVQVAKQWRALSWQGERLDLKRFSSSQQQEFRVPGVCGYLDLPEGAGELLPVLAASQWLHLGKSTNVGLGQLRLVFP